MDNLSWVSFGVERVDASAHAPQCEPRAFLLALCICKASSFRQHTASVAAQQRPWQYDPAQVWRKWLDGHIDRLGMRKLEAARIALQKHQRQDWEAGCLLGHFLEEVLQGNLIYPVALGHALVSGKAIYYDPKQRCHVWEGHEVADTWISHINAVVARSLFALLCARQPHLQVLWPGQHTARSK